MSHLVPVHAGWSAWRWIWLRGAGFPARHVLDLASPAVVTATTHLARVTDELATGRARVIGALREVRATKATNRAIRAIERGKVPAEVGDLEPEVAAGLAPLLLALRALVDEHARGSAALDAALSMDVRRSGHVLHALAREPRFREAMLWQNRRAVHNGIASLLRHPPEAIDYKLREQRRLLASFLQRYCVKNDTIGFFGPVGFAALSSSAEALRVTPGAHLLDKRTVYFEHWAIEAIAQAVGADPELRPFLYPRRTPTVRLEGDTVHYPVARTSRLPLPFARALAACDGRRTAREIAAALIADPAVGITTEAEAFELLEALAEKRFCSWAIEIPTVTEWPERTLRALLTPATGAVRDRALAALDALEARRDDLRAAAGDPEAIDRALGALETTFEELTSQRSTRKEGESYAGRTLVFEDCRRDLQVELGADIVRRLGPALALVLQSARWYTHHIAGLYRTALADAFTAAAAGATSIPYLEFWAHARALFPDRGRSSLIDQAAEELQRRWVAVTGFEPTAARMPFTTAALEARVAELFAAPHPGWPGARYHAPDVMIAAASTEAIRAGEGVFVMGELHPSVATMHYLAQKELDDRAPLTRARELDLPTPIPYPVVSKDNATRADHMWLSRHDIDIELGQTRSWRPRESVVAIADLIVVREGEQLFVRDREGRWSFDLVEFHGPHLSAAIGPEFDMFPRGEHSPRVTIDGVVIAREMWRFDGATLAFATSEQGAAQFAAAQAWRHALGLPRFVFVKVPEEPKPMYIDFDSPLFVEVLAKLVRKASRVTLSEMLPSPLETWLPDAAGQTYTCELRLLTVDPVAWQPPGGPRS